MVRIDFSVCLVQCECTLGVCHVHDSIAVNSSSGKKIVIALIGVFSFVYIYIMLITIPHLMLDSEKENRIICSVNCGA